MHSVIVSRALKVDAIEILDVAAGYAKPGWSDYLWLTGWRAAVAMFVLKRLGRGGK